MIQAETVTFGGGGLERSAHLRGDAATLSALWDGPSKVLLLWEGKPLVHRTSRSEDVLALDQLALLDTSHPMVAGAKTRSVFLGLDADGCGLFAQDLLEWQPAETDLDQLGAFSDLSEQQHPDLAAGEVFAELRNIMTALTPMDAEIAATAKAVLAWHHSHGFCAKCGAKSEMIDGGWQRLCSSCGTRHFPRTDPVVIMLITRGDKVLIGRSPGWPDGMYSLLAGFVEPGETLEAAVRREVLEETGVKVGSVGYLASQPWAFPMSLMFGCWGEAISEEITIDPVEIEDAIWATRQEIMEAQADLHPKIRPARKGAIARFLLDNWLADTVR